MRATRMRPTLPVKACDSYPPQTACLPGVHHRKSWEEAGPSLGCRTSSETSAPTRGSPPFPFPGPWPSQRRQSKLEEQGLASERSKQGRKHTSWRGLVHFPMASGVLRGQHSFGGVSGLNNSHMATQSPLARLNFSLCRQDLEAPVVRSKAVMESCVPRSWSEQWDDLSTGGGQQPEGLRKGEAGLAVPSSERF